MGRELWFGAIAALMLMIANGMKAVAGKAYLLISGLTPMPQRRIC